MRIWARGAVLAVLAAVAAPAHAMTVADMLARIEKLRGMGMMAMFHKGEIKALFAELRTTGDAYRADVAKAQAAGDTSLGCPPPRGSVKMSPDEIVERLKSVPVQARPHTTFKSFFYEMMKARFPCK